MRDDPLYEEFKDFENFLSLQEILEIFLKISQDQII